MGGKGGADDGGDGRQLRGRLREEGDDNGKGGWCESPQTESDYYGRCDGNTGWQQHPYYKLYVKEHANNQWMAQRIEDRGAAKGNSAPYKERDRGYQGKQQNKGGKGGGKKPQVQEETRPRDDPWQGGEDPWLLPEEGWGNRHSDCRLDRKMETSWSKKESASSSWQTKQTPTGTTEQSKVHTSTSVKLDSAAGADPERPCSCNVGTRGKSQLCGKITSLAKGGEWHFWEDAHHFYCSGCCREYEEDEKKRAAKKAAGKRTTPVAKSSEPASPEAPQKTTAEDPDTRRPWEKGRPCFGGARHPEDSPNIRHTEYPYDNRFDQYGNYPSSQRDQAGGMRPPLFPSDKNARAAYQLLTALGKEYKGDAKTSDELLAIAKEIGRAQVRLLHVLP